MIYEHILSIHWNQLSNLKIPIRCKSNILVFHHWDNRWPVTFMIVAMMKCTQNHNFNHSVSIWIRQAMNIHNSIVYPTIRLPTRINVQLKFHFMWPPLMMHTFYLQTITHPIQFALDMNSVCIPISFTFGVSDSCFFYRCLPFTSCIFHSYWWRCQSTCFHL